MRWIPRFLGPLLLLVFGVLCAEVVLRVVPSPVQYPPFQEFDDPDSLLGVELVASTKVTKRTACYTSQISTNALGWRDRERTIEKQPGVTRIAVLGDSFIEASQVGDEETMTRQLEELLGDRVEVLNFGMSSIGTVQEEILYDKVVRDFHPDIVLLAFYSNDVQNSDPVLEGGADRNTRLTYRDAAGELVSWREGTAFFGVRKWLRLRSGVFRLLKMAYGMARSVGEDSLPADTNVGSLPVAYGVYQDPPSAEWERGWRAVEGALVRLQREMGSGTVLLAFAVPELLQVAPDATALIRETYGKNPPEGFDALVPHDRFQQIAQRLRIPTIDLLPAFIAERERRQLEYPYFSYACDGHWNAAGHLFAAETLARFLLPQLDVRR